MSNPAYLERAQRSLPEKKIIYRDRDAQLMASELVAGAQECDSAYAYSLHSLTYIVPTFSRPPV